MEKRSRSGGVFSAVVATGIAVCGAGCSPSEPPAPPVPTETAASAAQPEGWDDELALPIPVDLNSDPHILEIELDARIAEVELAPGQSVPAWTYNGTVPGPLLRAAVGDRVIVHFTNHLPEPTTIHLPGKAAKPVIQPVLGQSVLG